MTSHAPTPGKPAQPAKNDIPSFDCCCWCCVVVARKESRLCRQKRNRCKFMSNALFNSCSCGSGFQPQAGSELYGSRYGLRCGLPYVLPCGLPCGLWCNDHRLRADLRLRKLVLAAEYRRVAHNPRKSFFALLGNAYLIIRVLLINL